MAAGRGAVLLSQTEGTEGSEDVFLGLGTGVPAPGVLPHHCGSGWPLSAVHTKVLLVFLCVYFLS